MKIVNEALVAETKEEESYQNLINCCITNLSVPPNKIGRLITTSEQRENAAKVIEKAFADYGYFFNVKIVDDFENPKIDFKLRFSWKQK